MSHTIQVVKGDKGSFRVLVNHIQEGCSVHSCHLANNQAVQLKDKYPSSLVMLFVESTPELFEKRA